MIVEQTLNSRSENIQRREALPREIFGISRSGHLAQISKRLLGHLVNLSGRISATSKIWSRPIERLVRPSNRRQMIPRFHNQDFQKNLWDTLLHKVGAPVVIRELEYQSKSDRQPDEFAPVSTGTLPTRQGQTLISLIYSASKSYPPDRLRVISRGMTDRQSSPNTTLYAEKGKDELRVAKGITDPHGIPRSQQAQQTRLTVQSWNPRYPLKSAGKISAFNNGLSDHIGFLSPYAGKVWRTDVPYREGYSAAPASAFDAPQQETMEDSTGGGGWSEDNPAVAATASSGDIYLDGNLLGRWMVRHLERVLTRPTLGSTGVDLRAVPAWPGMPIAS